MDGSRFDQFSRALGARLSRRRAAGGAATVGVAALGAAVARRGIAQEATPGASPSTVGTPSALVDGTTPQEVLFVQTFGGGTFLPKAGEAGTYTLTLTGHSADTVYFSDRPDRIVGTVPTVTFLETLGFTPENPPNAAIVTRANDGEAVVVVELTNPIYTESFGQGGQVTVTYDVTILNSYEDEGLAHLAAKQTGATLPETLGSTSLFIDDCPDQYFYCYTPESFVACLPMGGVTGGQCWHTWLLSCLPCTDTNSACNEEYPDDCGGRCFSKTAEAAEQQGCAF